MALNTHKKYYYDHPVSHQVLKSLLKDYKRPNDKIRLMLQQKELIALKRGLYVWNSSDGHFPEPFVLANVIYGPSYVSAESALAYHGLIPEQVFTVVSMTIKRSKSFENHFGRFIYKKMPTPYYAFGIDYIKLREGQFALMASPEKAIFDKIVTSPGILLRSLKSAQDYLLDNLRLDSEQLSELNFKRMESWLSDAPKQESLEFIIKALQTT